MGVKCALASVVKCSSVTCHSLGAALWGHLLVQPRLEVLLPQGGRRGPPTRFSLPLLL